MSDVNEFKRLLLGADTMPPLLKLVTKIMSAGGKDLYFMEDGGTPIKPRTVQEFGKAIESFESGDRIVGLDIVGGGRYRVSTVFIPINQSFTGGEPILYECMVFDDANNGEECYQWRCGGNRSNAVEMHKRVLAWVEAGMKGDGPEG